MKGFPGKKSLPTLFPTPTIPEYWSYLIDL